MFGAMGQKMSSWMAMLVAFRPVIKNAFIVLAVIFAAFCMSWMKSWFPISDLEWIGAILLVFCFKVTTMLEDQFNPIDKNDD